MSATFAMTLDGVLRDPHTEAVTTQGRALYHALASTGRLAILCGQDRDRAEWFLASNGLTQHAYLISEAKDSAASMSGRRMSQIIELRSQGCFVQFLVEADPGIAADLYAEGVPVLVYLHPQYTTPSFRPDYRNEAKPWNNLVKQVDYQMAMRAQAALDERDLIED